MRLQRRHIASGRVTVPCCKTFHAIAGAEVTPRPFAFWFQSATRSVFG